jgi:hypothetical protein
VDGVLGIPVAEIVLNELQIVAAIGTGAGLPHPHCRQAPWRQLRVAHRVGDRGMAKEVLDQPSVRPLVGESVARGVPLHVGEPAGRRSLTRMQTMTCCQPQLPQS